MVTVLSTANPRHDAGASTVRTGADNPEPLVVNGVTVPTKVIAAEVQNHAAPKNQPGLAWRKAANAVAMRTLLLQEAKQRGIRPEPRVLLRVESRGQSNTRLSPVTTANGTPKC